MHVSGLSYTYVEGTYANVPDFTSLTPTKTGTTADFNLTPRTQDDNFAFLFKGYIEVPTDGPYTFYTRSDDGSRLWIGGALVVDNDGRHGPIEKGGVMHLKSGKHPIEVGFFDRGGDQVLTVSYEGPGIAKRVIPTSVLFGPARTNTSQLADGLYELEPQHAVGKRLTVNGAATTNGRDTQLESANGTSSQAWQLTRVGADVYELSPQEGLPKRLDVTSGSTDNGTPVQIWTSNSTKAQRWKLIVTGNSVYELAPLCAPDKRLDVFNGSATEGTNVIIWAATGGASQQWKFLSKSGARQAALEVEGRELADRALGNYPNPFSEQTTLKFQVSSRAHRSVVQIYTVQGKLVRSIDVSGNQDGRYELSREDLGDGTYIYSLFEDGVLKASKRLIIGHE